MRFFEHLHIKWMTLLLISTISNIRLPWWEWQNTTRSIKPGGDETSPSIADMREPSRIHIDPPGANWPWYNYQLKAIVSHHAYNTIPEGISLVRCKLRASYESRWQSGVSLRHPVKPHARRILPHHLDSLLTMLLSWRSWTAFVDCRRRPPTATPQPSISLSNSLTQCAIQAPLTQDT